MSVFSPLGTFGALRNETSAANRGSSGCYMSSFYAPSSSVITSFVYRVQDGGNDTDYRLGIYKGGTDEDEISGAKLVWDSGLQSAEDLPTAGTMYWWEISLDIELEAGELYWFVFQSGPASPTQSVVSPDHGDLNLGIFFWLAAKGYLNDGFPATAPAKDGNTNLSQSLKAYIKLAVRETEEPVITFRKPWTEQPPAGTPIDWSNPLAKGLVFGVNYNQPAVAAGGTLRFEAGSAEYPSTGTGRPTAISAITGDFVPDYHGSLRGLKSSTGWFKMSLPNFDPTGGGDWSCFHLVKFHSTIDHMLLSIDTQADFQIWADVNVGQLRPALYDGAATYGSDGSIVTDQVYSLVFTHNDAADDVIFYQDGNNTISDLTFTQPNNDEMVWAGTGPGTKIANATWFATLFWDRPLTQGEVTALSQNPWQIFKPETIMVPAGDAAKRRVVVF